MPRWLDPDTLHLAEMFECDHGGLKVIIPKTVEIVNSVGKMVVVRYHAAGDYEDRWVDQYGDFHEPVKWRPYAE